MSLRTFLPLAALAALALLAPAATATQYLETGVHCGTTANAKYSDCLALINDDATWDAAFNKGNTCSFSNVISGQILATAYNVACHNDCCVYVAGYVPDQIDKYTTQREAASLLGCADTATDKINALYTFSDHGVCISSGSGCGDCFDDSDFS